MDCAPSRIVINDGRKPLLDSTVGGFILFVGLALPIATLFSGDPFQTLFQLPGMLIVGLPFAWGGSILLFRKSRMHIDLETRQLVSSSKYLWYPSKETHTSLNRFVSVTVATKRIRTSKSTRTYRSVFLVSDEPLSDIQETVAKSAGYTQTSVELFRYRSDQDAQSKGQEIASRLSLPLEVKDAAL